MDAGECVCVCRRRRVEQGTVTFPGIPCWLDGGVSFARKKAPPTSHGIQLASAVPYHDACELPVEVLEGLDRGRRIDEGGERTSKDVCLYVPTVTSNRYGHNRRRRAGEGGSSI